MKKVKRPDTFEITETMVTMTERPEGRVPLCDIHKATDLMTRLFPGNEPKGPFIYRMNTDWFSYCLSIRYDLSVYDVPFHINLDFPEWPEKYANHEFLQIRLTLPLPKYKSAAQYMVIGDVKKDSRIVTLDGSHPNWYFVTNLMEMYLKATYTCQEALGEPFVTNPDFYPYL